MGLVLCQPVRQKVVEDTHEGSLGPFCGGVCEVEVVLTIHNLTETDVRRASRQTDTGKYRDACASKSGF